MMRKIKSIKQLQAEKKLIRQHQEELKNKITANWKELKELLRPGNMAKDMIEGFVNKKAVNSMNEGSIIKTAISAGIAMLANKLAGTAADKFSRLFNR